MSISNPTAHLSRILAVLGWLGSVFSQSLTKPPFCALIDSGALLRAKNQFKGRLSADSRQALDRLPEISGRLPAAGCRLPAGAKCLQGLQTGCEGLRYYKDCVRVAKIPGGSVNKSFVVSGMVATRDTQGTVL